MYFVSKFTCLFRMFECAFTCYNIHPVNMGRLKYGRHDAWSFSNKMLSKMHENTVAAVDCSKLFSQDDYMIFLRV